MRTSALRVAAFLMVPGLASAATFTPLGTLHDYDDSSEAYAASADGAVVVGSSENNGSSYAFRWTIGGGMVGLGSLKQFGNASSNGVSDDGLVVVGGSDYDNFTFQAYRWTESGGMVGVGDLPGGGFSSSGYGVSGNGSVVVGRSSSGTGDEAFRWTSAGGMVGLGTLGAFGARSYAYDASTDGAVVVGYDDGSNEAFRWTSAGGMVGLGDLPGNSQSSRAYGVSGDGSVVVGEGQSAAGNEAFRWTSAGGMVGLGDLPGGTFSSTANSVSGDGSVVVGSSESAIGTQAFVWTQAGGMQLLRDVLATNGATGLSGWFLDNAWGVSADGSVVVGSGINPVGDREAFAANILPSDTAPSLFSFIDQTGVGLSVPITSAPVTITGITTPTPVAIIGGQYSVGCTITFTGAAGTITNGQTVCVRQTSAATPLTQTSTTLTVGGLSDAFVSTTGAAPPDTTADPFTFTDQTGVALSTVVTSAPVTITGLTAAASVSISGGEYSVGCTATYVNTQGNVSDNQGVCVRHTSAATNSTATSTTLTVGGVSGVFRSTTVAASGGGGGGGGGGALDGLSLLALSMIGVMRRKARWQ